jgi:hypothetical protein
MLYLCVLLLLFLQASPSTHDDTVDEVANSGRCADLSETPDQRVSPAPSIAPGAAPALSFRFYEGKQHKRYDNGDLLLDDAGH